MALIRKIESNTEYVFRFGKYQGKSLDEVAEEDPSYLVWAWKELSKEESREYMDAVEDVMEAHDIEVP